MRNDHQPEVTDTGGTLPSFWDHNVLFIANLLALFFGNDQETELLSREIHGAETYGGRLVPILNLLYRGKGNRLLLEREPEPHLLGYFRDILRLKLPKVDILSHDAYRRMGAALQSGATESATSLLNALPTDGIATLDGYVTDDILAAIAAHLDLPTVSRPSGSRRGNNKLLLHQALVEAGLPAFETRLAHAPEEVGPCLRHLARAGYRSAVIKSQVGASGIGMVRLPLNEPHAGLSDLTDLMFHEGPCLVQGWLEPGLHGVTDLTSPSVQAFLGQHTVELYDVTEQILSDESIHQGNESPPPYLAGDPGLRDELFYQAGEVSRWLHRQGYRGTASVDFVVTRGEESSRTVYVCEINARVTGATYPSVLARHFLPGGSWVMRNLQMLDPLPGEALLNKLMDSGQLYRPGAAAGILPINFNTDSEGRVHKGQFLCLAGSVADCHAFLNAAERTLKIPWNYVRD